MRPRLLVLALLFVLSSCVFILSSCDCATRPRASTTSPRTSAPAATSPEAPSPSTAAVTLPEPIEVRFSTLDGVPIHGVLYPGLDPRADAVVLVHTLGADHREWSPWIDAFREPPGSLAVLAIDLRGHGASTAAEDGSPLDHASFDTATWERTSKDVDAAVAFLRSAAAPVQPRRIALVGASIGATAVVRAAAEDPSIDVIVLLSPGRAYRGVDSILVATPMRSRHLLALAARSELDSTETAEALARITDGRAEIVEGEGHGVGLLALNPALAGEVVDFVRRGLERDPPSAEPR